MSAFPRTRWLAALRHALQVAPNAAFGFGDPRGHPPLRTAIADYAGRARGVVADPENIVVCNGFSHALSLLAEVVSDLRPGPWWMENPCLYFHPDIVARRGQRPLALPVDAKGARTDLLGSRDATAVLLTPAHQFPLGAVLHPARRAAALAWARTHDTLVVEDDYDGEFRYDRQPVGALQARDPSRVVYVGTASKSLAPGLRLAWMVLPPSLVEPVVEARRLSDRHSGVVEQLALARFIESGDLDRHVRRCRAGYRRRRDRLVALLAERVPAVQALGVAAGQHVVLALPPGGPSEAEATAFLAARSVAVDDLGKYRHRAADAPLAEADWLRAGDAALSALIVGYSTPSQAAFSGAVDLLTRALGDLVGTMGT